jgi:hypothetical protein
MRLARKAALVVLELVVLVGELRVLSKWCQEKRCISMLAVQVENLRLVGMVVEQHRTLTVVVVAPLIFVVRLL